MNMKNTTKFPKSIRKYIRLEKARIRRQFKDVKEQEKAIDELYSKSEVISNYRKHVASSKPVAAKPSSAKEVVAA